MARTVPPAIAEALATKAATPALSVILQDAFDRPDPLDITSAHAGRSSIIRLPDQTSYVRAYVNQPGAGLPAAVYTQLVCEAANPADWVSYDLRADNARQEAGTALALFGDTIFLFYVRVADSMICFQTSTDGIGWSTEAEIDDPASCWAMASAGNGDVFVAVNHDSLHDGAQDVLYYTWDGSSWTMADTWTNPPVQISGLSAVWNGGAYRIAMGAQSRRDGALALCAMTRAGGAWSQVTPIHPLDDPATGRSCPYPGLALVDNRYRVASVVYDDGSDTGIAGSCCEMWTSPDFIHWHIEQLLDRVLVNGAEPAPGPGGKGWLLADAGNVVLSEAAAGTSLRDIDVSDRVLSLHIHEHAGDTTTAQLIVVNDDAALTPATPPTSAVRLGATIRVELGYDGATVHTHTLYVDSIETVEAAEYPSEASTPPVASLRILASNRARMLDRPVSIDRTHDGATLLFLATEVAINGGLHDPPTAAASAQFSQTLDTFAIHTGASWKETLERLARLYGFDWILDGNEQLSLLVPQAGDLSSHTYTSAETTGHAITPRRRINSVRVVGAGPTGKRPPYAESIDAVAIQDQGEIIHRDVADRLLATSAKCAIRSSLELRRAERSALSGWLHIPLNPEHQPLDVISIADDQTAATVRITAIDWIVERGGHAFHQLTHLEAP